MRAPELPPIERQRQTALDDTGLLDSKPEERFDRLTRMARQIFDMPISLVSLVDRNRQWFKSRQGLDALETPRDISFCGHAILQPDIFIIEDTLADTRFCDNPLVVDEPRIRFYAGAPLRSRDGFRLGTLCLIDRVPRSLDKDQQAVLRDLADCVEREINLQNTARHVHDLKHSERRARAAIEGTRVGTWEWNVQTGETVFNERWAEICGYSLAELEPITVQTWFNLIHPDDLAESERRLSAHFDGDAEEYDVCYRMLHRDGHVVWVHARGRVFEWTADGKPLIMYGTHADITAETENLARIQQQNTALSILNDLALNPDTDDRERICEALRLGAEYLRMPLAIVSEITGGVYKVLCFQAPPDSGLSEGQTFPLEHTYCSIMVERNDYLAIDHMATSQYRGRPCYQQFGLESYIAAPIRLQERTFGTLNFSSPEPRPEGFSDTEKTFVTLLGRWVSGVLERQFSNEMVSKLVEQTPGMLYQFRRWPDGHSAFPFASPGIRELWGLEPEQVKTDATAIFNGIHPDDLDATQASIVESATRLSTWQHQLRIRRAGAGGWRWVEGRSTPEKLADGSVIWHGYITDIDDKKKTQLVLQESEAQLRNLFELSPVGIALNDFYSGQFLDVNDALLNPTGYSREQMLQMSGRQLVSDDQNVLLEKVAKELREHGRFGPFEQDILRRDGSAYPSIIHGLRIVNSAGRPLIWTLVEDISERKKIERMKNEFISTVSHELRTPLTSIAGSLSLITGGAFGALPEPVTRMIGIAARNSDQLKHLIDDLLDMDKLLSGTMSISLQQEPAGRLISDALNQLRTYSVDRNIRLRLDSDHADTMVCVDPQRFQQALSNLLSNAIKFSEANSEVMVSTKRHGERLRILVRDRGPGIPADFHSRIFQKFAQADSSSTRDQRGTGLGLAITQEIMTQMHGDVGFQSKEGHGATFWLDVPMA